MHTDSHRAPRLLIRLGTSHVEHSMSVQWKLGPVYFLEEALPSTAIQTLYNLGYLYCANFMADFSQYQTYEIINSTHLSANESDMWSILDLSSTTANFTVSQQQIVLSLHAMNKKIVNYTRKDGKRRSNSNNCRSEWCTTSSVVYTECSRLEFTYVGRIVAW